MQNLMLSLRGKFIKIFAVLSFLLYFSCRNEKEEIKTIPRAFEGYHVYLDSILISKKGLARGLSLNIPYDSVLKHEKIPPVEKKTEKLYYEYRIDSLTDYTVEYFFNNDSLFEIDIKIYTTNVDLANYLYCDLKDYYSFIVPENIEEKGYVVYNCVEGERRPFVISLSDYSTTHKGIIHLTIYKD